jgi:hypothetical protein
MKCSKLSSRAAALTLGIVVVSLLAGCGGGGGGGSSDPPPTITNARGILPSGFSFQGESITIQADVTDNFEVGAVRAIISKGATTLATVPLQHIGVNAYSTAYKPNANTSTSAPVTYTVVITAADTMGHAAASKSFTFDVPAAPAPPGKPF